MSTKKKSPSARKKKPLPSLTDKRLARISAEAFAKAREGAMELMGYVIEVRDSNLVRVNSDGTIEILKQL